METNFDIRWPLTKAERKFLKKIQSFLPEDIVSLSSSLKTIYLMIKKEDSVNEKLQKLFYIKYGLEFHLKALYFRNLTAIE